jgi:hypothetical protein
MGCLRLRTILKPRPNNPTSRGPAITAFRAATVSPDFSKGVRESKRRDAGTPRTRTGLRTLEVSARPTESSRHDLTIRRSVTCRGAGTPAD